MGNRICEITEKCLVLIVFDEFHRMFVYGILRITSVLILFFLVIPQILRVVRVRFTLTVVSVKYVESHLVSFSARTGITHTPFTETTCHISVLLKQMSQRFYIRIERLLSFGLYFFISPYFGMSGVLPGHQRSS